MSIFKFTHISLITFKAIYFDASAKQQVIIADLKLYSGYRESSLPWLGKVPLLEEGGIVAFIRHFYKPQPLRTLEEITSDIFAIEQEAEGLLDGLLKGGAR